MSWKPADIAMVKALGGGSEGGGVTPNIQATAETLPAGSEATVTRTGSDANPVFNFGIPEGEPGKPGDPGQPGKNGEDGVTPDIQVGTVTTLESGQNATVTRQPTSPDSAPVFDFGIPKGEDGAPGQKGDPGKDATVNGKNAITLAAGDNVTITTGADGTVTISSTGGGGSGGGEIYSTEEQVIGTWINGKQIYRKAILGTVPSESTSRFSTIIEKNNISPDLELGINAWGIYKGPSVTARFPTPEVSGDNTYVAIHYVTGSNDIEIKCKMTSMVGKDVWIIAEYTKTTDPATIEIPSILTVSPEQSDSQTHAESPILSEKKV